MTREDERSDPPDVDAEDGWTFDEGDDASAESAPVGEGNEASEESGQEPLGGLRDRVSGEDEAAPPTLFPDESPAAAAGDGDASGDEAPMGDDASGDGAPVGADAGGDGSAPEDGPRVPADGHEGPLGDLAAGVEGRRERNTKADEELFDEVDVGELDADELWAQVETDEPTVEPRGEREVREVQKRKYCSQCPYFADPPEVGCSHEGTDILEQVDMEHFKVADCPVILEDERLEDVTTE
ncbi:hypothetical protein [Halorubellus sp. PRR65]|uniref:hypothetical protein n=1 Tax=Halorubellus sp. PRR65 TaxID=3098148 RepID=UPI002B25CCE2|nr:hypothetical protein [Halorubellus sp. PRR65]